MNVVCIFSLNYLYSASSQCSQRTAQKVMETADWHDQIDSITVNPVLERRSYSLLLWWFQSI
jgi:hypothetical protein